MKKNILILMTLVLLVSGCGKKASKTFTCTYENTNEGTKYKTEIIAEVDKDGNIIDATAVMNYEDKDYAKEMCNLYSSASDSKNVKCEDKKITIKKYDKSLSRNETLTEKEFLDYMDNRSYTCK